jgi:ribonuclease BN (tRNA processing enzyme)
VLAFLARLGCVLLASSAAGLLVAAVLLLPPQDAYAQSVPSRTQIVLLGTGNSGLLPDRSGPATAIVVNDRAYLVDFGPGIVQRAMAAQRKGVAALHPANLTRAFVTHLHADHTVGYPDLILTPWLAGRRTPLEVYGPPGIAKMTEQVLAAWAEDIAIRNGPVEHALHSADGYRVNAHEISAGAIYKDGNVAVMAFNVKHAEWGTRAFGYRLQSADRTIVISGDTAPSENVVRQCNGCDLLIHEVYTEAGYARASPEWQRMLRESHTSSRQLAELATRARPRLLVLYHQNYQSSASNEEDLMREMREFYRGRFVSGHDLDVF